MLRPIVPDLVAANDMTASRAMRSHATDDKTTNRIDFNTGS
jgi:hypothetical protein